MWSDSTTTHDDNVWIKGFLCGQTLLLLIMMTCGIEYDQNIKTQGNETY